MTEQQNTHSVKSWLVAIDGSGEYETDYSVIVVTAATAREAVEKLIQPGYGAGKEVAYVAPLKSVSIFGLAERSVKSTVPLSFEERVNEMRDLGHHLDHDNITGTAVKP